MCYFSASITNKASSFLADLSDDYAGRPWCQAEARAIRALRFQIDPARDEVQRLRLLNVRFGPGEVPGVFKTTGYLDGINKKALECADLILKRLSLLRERLAPGGPTESQRISHTADQAVVLHNLPFAPNPLFTGRDAELEALRQGLQQCRAMAVTQTVAVHGLGGVGKTQLAVQYAWNHLREFEAVLWVRGDSPEALEASLARLASVLRLREAEEHEQAVQSKAVLRWLGEHDRWLLIIDNADTEAAVRAVRQRVPPSCRSRGWYHTKPNQGQSPPRPRKLL